MLNEVVGAVAESAAVTDITEQRLMWSCSADVSVRLRRGGGLITDFWNKHPTWGSCLRSRDWSAPRRPHGWRHRAWKKLGGGDRRPVIGCSHRGRSDDHARRDDNPSLGDDGLITDLAAPVRHISLAERPLGIQSWVKRVTIPDPAVRGRHASNDSILAAYFRSCPAACRRCRLSAFTGRPMNSTHGLQHDERRGDGRQVVYDRRCEPI